MSKKLLIFFKSPSFFIIFFATGIITGSVMPSTRFFISIVVLLVGILLVALLLKTKILAISIVLMMMGAFYFWIFSTSSHNLPAGCHNVSVSSNPQSDNEMLKFAVQNASGRAFINLKTADRLQYSDKINICFETSNIAPVEGSYSRYLEARYLTNKLIRNPDFEFIASGKSPLRYLYSFSAGVSDDLGRIFSGDGGVLAKGLILGGSQGFSPSFVEDLRSSGTTHLIAVSGYNVSIITVVLFQLIRTYFSRRVAIITTAIVLLSFCLLTGATSSVLRASLMGFLYLFAKCIGRRGATTNALFVAALIMLLYNPYAIYDVGFQLSFTATLGLVMLEEPLRVIFSRLATFPEALMTAATSTLAAQVFTLPILLFQFGQISLVAPIANTLILPVVPLAMFMVALTYIVEKIVPIIGIFVSGLTQVLLDYIMLVIEFFGGFTFSALTIEGMSWVYLVLLYFGVFILATYLKTRSRKIIRGVDGQPL